MAEKQIDSSWRIFNGNEIAAILVSWILKALKSNEPKSHSQLTLKSKETAMLSTLVSSRLLKKICEAEGFAYERVASGFKNIGNLALNLLQEALTFVIQNISVPFMYEEAIGYCIGPIVLDKDGISTAVYAASCIYGLNGSLSSELSEVYDKYNKSYTLGKIYLN
jgi:phosphomannomutase